MEARTLDYGAIGWALNHARHGHQVRRKGWNGKDMWVTYVPAGAMQFPEKYGGAGDTQAMLVLHTPNGQLAVWTATTADLLAADWELVGETQPGSYA